MRILGACLLLACSACAERDDGLLVFAASSLTEAFETLVADARADGLPVDLATAGSQALRLQIEGGAPADVFASAHPAHMQPLLDGGWLSDSQVFAHNALAIAVAPGNPQQVRQLSDLARLERVVLAAPEVPAGRYARAVLDRLDPAVREAIGRRVVSHELNVRLALAKVELGEADAALVYRSDLQPHRRAEAVTIPAELQPEIALFIGAGGGARKAAASRFIARVHSERGRAVLAAHGFIVE